MQNDNPQPTSTSIDISRIADFADQYDDTYFANRHGGDPLRQKSFADEARFIRSHRQAGVLLDVGCGTGEFLAALQWNGPIYGMEIARNAILEAQKRGICFDKSLINENEFFDIIIFRGTIQHIPVPFAYLQFAYQALKPGGHVVFLATPNANSIYYKIWNTLPALEPEKNFFIPSDIVLINAMRNIGFNLCEIRYPYWSSPYASPIRDHWNFVCSLFGRRRKFPFWRNMMDAVFEKQAPDV